jgi:hypothetical protein
VGDGLEYKLVSWNQLPFNAPEGADLPWGFRLSPGARLNLGDFFSELRFEGGAARAATTPIGDNYFEATPSSTLSNKVFGCYVYTPTDAKDTQRANFCVRGLLVGYKFSPDFQIRLGRNRYEVTEYESMFMANSFGHTPHWANVYIPYGWLGGELRFDQKHEEGTFRRLMASAGIMNGADGGYLAILQGLSTIALSEEKSAPKFTLTAYGIIRGNPNVTDPKITDPGSTNGEGFGIQYDHGLFSGGMGFNHQLSTWQTVAGLEGSQARDEVTTFANVHPESFMIRGAFSHLVRLDEKGENASNPPQGLAESRLETTVSYLPVKGIQLSLGYIGAYSSNVTTHMGFLGALTTYEGLVPFTK